MPRISLPRIRGKHRTLGILQHRQAVASYEGLIPSRGCSHLYCASGAQGVLPCKGRAVTQPCKLDGPSPTELSVAGCGRLQLGVDHWATSVPLLQVV